MNALTQFRLIKRPWGDCLQHQSLPLWIVYYEATRERKAFYEAYRAIYPVPAGRDPWSIDNRKVSDDGYGFKTAAQAAKAALKTAP